MRIVLNIIPEVVNVAAGKFLVHALAVLAFVGIAATAAHADGNAIELRYEGHRFSPANLTALRELALRRTAERVDEQLLSEMQAHAIPGPWAAGERILVCISEDRRCAGLVRYAKRLADRLHGPWTALYAEGRRATDQEHVASELVDLVLDRR